MSTKKKTDIDEVPVKAKTRVPRARSKDGTSMKKVKSPDKESSSVPKKTVRRKATAALAQESVAAGDLLNDLGSLPRSYG